MKIEQETPKYRDLRRAYTLAKALGDKAGAKEAKGVIQEFGRTKAEMRRAGTLPRRFPRK